MTDQADAIVVGSGINGMVSAAELARAGWSVILLECNAEIGGFKRSQ
jgi:phytoene dehydrogenase-like protein